MKTAVAVVFYKPSLNDLLISINNISKFSVALIVWNSKPLDLSSIAKNNNIKLNNVCIHYLINEKNLGIGGGLNIALKFASEINLQYILALDQDSFIIMRKELLDKYFCFFKKIHDCGCIGFKRIKGKFETLSPLSSKNKISNPNEKTKKCVRGDLLNYSYMHSGTVYDVKIFTKLRGFKQEYFMEFTDIEYSLRVKKNNFKLLLIEDSLIIHDAGVQTNSRKNFLYHPLWISYLQYRNLIITLKENIIHSPKWSFKTLTILIFINPIRIFINHKSLSKLILVFFAGSIDGIISIYKREISTYGYRLLIERWLNFKVPIIKKFKFY